MKIDPKLKKIDIILMVVNTVLISSQFIFIAVNYSSYPPSTKLVIKYII